jgi:mono/diheme cytochrome c family protein
MRLNGFAFTVLLLVAPAINAAEAADVDPTTGLLIAPGWELVNAHCGVCHSHRLVTAQRGDADFWLNTIRWMQRTQGLWDLPPEQEQIIVEYLSTNYSESEWGRRPPLAASLMPTQASPAAP